MFLSLKEQKEQTWIEGTNIKGEEQKRASELLFTTTKQTVLLLTITKQTATT